MPKILIADDHPIVREGLKQILIEAFDNVVIDEAASGIETLISTRKQTYNIVLLDIMMPKGNGIDILKQIRSENPALPVLVLSIYPEEQYAVRVIKNGASGYLEKTSAPEELINAIRKILSGNKYITSSIAEKLADYIETDTEKPLHETLSDREYTVFTLIASGKTTREISEELSLSIKTISTYRARVLDKMKLKNNAQLIQYALTNKLVV